MKPLNFDYTKDQEDTPFPSLKYNHKKQLNTLKGKIFINSNDESTKKTSKTFTRKEDDDLPKNNLLLKTLTKTKTKKEEDDDRQINNGYLLKLLSKTDTKKEADDKQNNFIFNSI